LFLLYAVKHLGDGSAPNPGADRFRGGSALRGEPVQPGFAARGHRPPEGNGEVDGPKNRLQPRGNGYSLLGLMTFLQTPLTHSSFSRQHFPEQQICPSLQHFPEQQALLQQVPEQQLCELWQHFPEQQKYPGLQHFPSQQACPLPQHTPSQQVSSASQHDRPQAFVPLGHLNSAAACPSAARSKPSAASTAPPSAAPTVPSILRRETGLPIARDTSSNSELIVSSPLF
jgi:hypothetical protein